ncbi:MAG: hypothetical protein ACM3ZF_10195 [Mycobacterium leprae]
MARLAEDYEHVRGGDPDRDSVDVAVLDAATGAICADVSDRADGGGDTRLLAWARTRAPGRRVLALGGTASFAVGLVRALAEAGEVVEVPRAQRARGAKSDRSDPVRARMSRSGRERQTAPRARGLREALRQIDDPARGPGQPNQGDQRTEKA